MRQRPHAPNYVEAMQTCSNTAVHAAEEQRIAAASSRNQQQGRKGKAHPQAQLNISKTTENAATWSRKAICSNERSKTTKEHHGGSQRQHGEQRTAQEAAARIPRQKQAGSSTHHNQQQAVNCSTDVSTATETQQTQQDITKGSRAAARRSPAQQGTTL